MNCPKSKKVCFPSHRAALIAGGKQLEKNKNVADGAKWFRAYKCDHCGHYHLTSK